MIRFSSWSHRAPPTRKSVRAQELGQLTRRRRPGRSLPSHLAPSCRSTPVQHLVPRRWVAPPLDYPDHVWGFWIYPCVFPFMLSQFGLHFWLQLGGRFSAFLRDRAGRSQGVFFVPFRGRLRSTAAFGAPPGFEIRFECQSFFFLLWAARLRSGGGTAKVRPYRALDLGPAASRRRMASECKMLRGPRPQCSRPLIFVVLSISLQSSPS